MVWFRLLGCRWLCKRSRPKQLVIFKRCSRALFPALHVGMPLCSTSLKSASDLSGGMLIGGAVPNSTCQSHCPMAYIGCVQCDPAIPLCSGRASWDTSLIRRLLQPAVASRLIIIFTRKQRRMWPLQMTVLAPPKDITTARFMHRTRKLLDIRHIWERLDIQWDLLQRRLMTAYPTGLIWDELYNRLFLNQYQGSMKWKEDEYSGRDTWAVWNRCDNTPKTSSTSIRWLFEYKVAIRPPFVGLELHCQQFDEQNKLIWTTTMEHMRLGIKGRVPTEKNICLTYVTYPCRHDQVVHSIVLSTSLTLPG